MGHDDDIIGLDFSPDGTLLATGCDDCTCRVWDLRLLGSSGSTSAAAAGGAGKTHLFCLQHQDEVKRLEWSPCGRMLSTASFDGRVFVWQISEVALARECLCVMQRSVHGLGS